MNPDELAARLLATFLGELDEQVGAMNADLLALEAEPDNGERLRSLFRVLHTVKGAARVAGAPPIEQACHALEAGLVHVREGRGRLDPEHFRLLYAAADALADAGQRIRAGRGLEDAPLARLLATLAAAPPPRPAEPAPSAAPPPRARPAESPAAEHPDGAIRVHTEEFDSLLAMAGDLLITSGQVSARPRELEDLQRRLTRIAAEWRRAGARLAPALERAGAPAALLEPLREVEDRLHALAQETAVVSRGASDDARTLARITEEVTETVHRLRLRPFADACAALPRAVRDVATAAGRAADLQLSGQDVRVDRAVVAALREPLLHLVRNAVDHGIEPPEARRSAGKPERGTVRVEATLVGGRLVVRVSDDGGGLDIAAIRAGLEQRGLEVAPDEREIVRSLFTAGLSTRAEATTISGRGVGLDLVRATMERIGGSVDANWTPGLGTTFTLECPPTPARIRALLVAAGRQVFAFPTAHVERLHRVAADEIRYAEGRPVLAVGEGVLPLGSLAAILGPPLAPKPVSGTAPVVVLSAGGHRLGVVVEELLAEQELVFRPLERGRSSLPHVSGGALLPSGEVALVLNPVGVVGVGLGQSAPAELPLDTPAPAEQARRRVLVVDDSITTRTLEQSVLEAAGYDVVTAVDGAAAWQLLQEERVELVVADVEMPRMDGFALCEAIRASRRLGELPVVLVTALEAPEHRARGLEAGADAYLPKSSFDQEVLLDTIRQLLGTP